MDSVIEDLRALNADIICLQEAEAGTSHAGGADQAAYIARQLGMDCHSAGSAFPNGGEQRMAILSKDRLSDRATLDAGTGRIYGVTAVVQRADRSIRVVSVHLTSSFRADLKHVLRTSSARLKEAVDLTDRVNEWPDRRIVAGDFNSVAGMPAWNHLAKHLAAVPTTQPTYPSDGPLLAIDHILCSPDLRPTDSRVINTHASDHLPVVLVVRAASPGRP